MYYYVIKEHRKCYQFRSKAIFKVLRSLFSVLNTVNELKLVQEEKDKKIHSERKRERGRQRERERERER